MGTREHFAHELGTVRADLIALGQMTATALAHAVAALERREQGWAQRVIAGDAPINAAAQRLEAHALQLIATQQPVATDLRRLIAAIKIGSELERIADYAKGIARIVVRHAAQLPPALPPDLLALSKQALAMLDAALAAFAAQDAAAARALSAADDVADALHAQAEAALLEQMQGDPAAVPWGVGLLLVAHHLERVADRATNLAERVVFLAAGEVVELNP
ncbi:MAG: phosphate signaling complex protein PhoU [Chloroflexales bacterium]|nr:phosphate signaling complex protein PhoU [Chloroflexales bacterium]